MTDKDKGKGGQKGRKPQDMPVSSGAAQKQPGQAEGADIEMSGTDIWGSDEELEVSHGEKPQTTAKAKTSHGLRTGTAQRKTAGRKKTSASSAKSREPSRRSAHQKW